ncbi:FdtA/QdtA family cupin domain-containing protein [Seonamhaeicola sp.]|uniref:sugar 3,4-ketoisomerase n=1 Tax=Seonamhaeicola sp. TaxID=1912245 RepID=UPI00260ED05B|nr:FdtA/QdtA family cupin domain-containing protein [Seonamhaeicola sp.]
MKQTTLSDIRLIDVPKVHDKRGSLVVIENDSLVFNMERVYYLYDVPTGGKRGGHAHKELYQLLIPLSGSFDVYLSDGKSERTVFLNKPNKALLIVPGIWREISNFSSGSVCLVIASEKFEEDDYIRDYELFLKAKN